MSKKKERSSKSDSRIYHEVIGVLLIGVGLFALISIYTNQAGIVGKYLKQMVMGLFGLVGYAIPLLLVISGMLTILAYRKRVNKLKLLLIVLTVVFVMSITHISYFSHFDWTSITTFVHSSYIKGQEVKGSGALLAPFAFAIYKLFGLAGSYVLLGAFVVINLLLLTNLSLRDMGHNIYSSIKPVLHKRCKPFVGKTIPVEEFKKKNGEDLRPLNVAFEQKNEALPLTRQRAKKREGKDGNQQQEAQPQNARLEALQKEGYIIPPLDLLKLPPASSNDREQDKIAESNAKLLEETLSSFGVSAKVTQISRGPVITRYELQPAPGVKVSRIVSLADDIALNLAAPSVRIEAPIPGKAAVGIEVPNRDVSPVLLREVLGSEEFIFHPSKLAVALGKDIAGKNIIADIARMPHLLIAGATGSGKSVCINTIIVSILYKASPREVKFIMVDPKVVELNHYNGIPHLLIPVVTNPKKAAGALNWAVQEMVSRYNLFADAGVKDIEGYNSIVESEDERLPQIVVIIDELADLMMVSPSEVEDAICRLAQMARAAGIHLVIATQRPSVDVITGLIKANIPSRIAFAVSSQVDSRTILDMNGAEKLLGRGDMLFYPVGVNKPIRVQGCFISEKEVKAVVEYIKSQNGAPLYDADAMEKVEEDDGKSHNLGEHDELLPEAIEIVIEAGQASISMLQRRLRIGYARAARLIDEMEARGIVSGFEGSKPRSVLITREEFERLYKDAK
ncbi:S-DNA-T family DNA segregation ATPase FtsK/SpoIIIE [Caldicoprobacter guelmensis]|uniref:FtsK/SpoIIIE family DNA translocase n=1 Tax=Caldicoprobacter guelmensis TaxID=1170224 RepID=UPI001958DB33|nr:DNA translocase FtsK [Caldicoprobacter guelmensis]MBM7581464.1 S-DNA-T family DNA segregation ATPase FtsK/SpoIIIE [Caldicoprobacter guelmensis]